MCWWFVWTGLCCTDALDANYICRRVNLAVLNRSDCSYLPAHSLCLCSARRLERKSCFTVAHKGKYNSLDVVWEPPLSWEVLFLGSLHRLEAETECTHRHHNFSDCPSVLVACVRPLRPDLLCSSSDTLGMCPCQGSHCLTGSTVSFKRNLLLGRSCYQWVPTFTEWTQQEQPPLEQRRQKNREFLMCKEPVESRQAVGYMTSDKLFPDHFISF